MVGVMVASAILAAAWQNAAIDSSRKALVGCLREAVKQAQDQKMAPDGFAAFAHQSCATAETEFTTALWGFDSKNKVPKRQSESDAKLQIEDYIASAEDKYRGSLPE